MNSRFIIGCSIALVASWGSQDGPRLATASSLSSVSHPMPLLISQKPSPVELTLTVEKQVLQGAAPTTWQPLQGNVTVKPGETLRYTLTGQNRGKRAIKNLTMTQPIPRQMVYLPNSAIASAPAEITFSADDGKSFSKTPTIPIKLPNGQFQAQAAPVSAYTHVRWKFSQVEGTTAVRGSYQVRVR